VKQNVTEWNTFMAEYSNKWWDFVNTVMNIHGP